MQAILEQLRQLTTLDIQSNWHSGAMPAGSPRATLNPQGYITWSKGNQEQWLSQILTIPAHLSNYPIKGLALRLHLTWWATAAEIYINDQLVREGDLFDSSCHILIKEEVSPGEQFLISLKLTSPGHDLGALMQSSLSFEKSGDPGFIADQLTILAQYLQAFQPESLPKLETALNTINWELTSQGEAFDECLATISASLEPLTEVCQARKIYLLGHAHLDLAWLWTVSETWQVAQNTFTSVLNLQQEFPQLIFGHSTAALYHWLEEHRPDLWAAIATAIAAGKWEILGGMWVEPEVNLIGGESLIRQCLYGQLYFESRFGQICTVGWLPDSFGFPWQLPQILTESGIKYFVTGKLHWNDTTTFPHGLFNWQAPDGSTLVTLISPPNRTGVMDTNPVTMANYAVEWEKQTGLTEAFWLPGVGDHGGGPTREMLELQQRWQQSPFIPKMAFTKVQAFLEGQTVANLPLWRDELYLEFHRGCYTTHADQKLYNRTGEKLLYQAELFFSLSHLLANQENLQPFPLDQGKAQLTEAWQKLLFNQFHDILPGTSIKPVFTEANQQWQAAIALAQGILTASLEAIASAIHLPRPPHPAAKPLVIFNPLCWNRSEIVTISPPVGYGSVYNLDGQPLLTQITQEQQLLFLAADLPSLGYRLFWVCPETTPPQSSPFPTDYCLDNGLLRVTIDPTTGDIASIFDYSAGREVLAGAGNQLQAFQDEGQYWDAWNIAPQYSDHPLPPSQLHSIQWLEAGPWQWRVRVVRQLGQSQFQQDYLLQKFNPVLTIRNQVQWQETHVLVKAAFPCHLYTQAIASEIACGVITRPTGSQTPKWEIPALSWSDLTDDSQNYGVSLLSDCKHGYDSQPHQIRLTLLRSPTWPDPEADQGGHQFSYGFYPHQGDWRLAQTQRRSYEFNFPCLCYWLPNFPSGVNLTLPPAASLLSLEADNLFLIALKPGEKDGWILRCYEGQGREAVVNFQGYFQLNYTARVDLLERDKTIGTPGKIQPWQIASFRCG